MCCNVLLLLVPCQDKECHTQTRHSPLTLHHWLEERALRQVVGVPQGKKIFGTAILCCFLSAVGLELFIRRLMAVPIQLGELASMPWHADP